MKTILVAVSGMSPAILTESLWALATGAPAIIPDEVVVITTSRGREDIEHELLRARQTWGERSVWETLRGAIFRRAGIPAKSRKLQLSVRVIEVPDEISGVRQPAVDLRTLDDNKEAADFIVRVVAEFCDAHDIHVIASIAGGRKTMGALLYAAMSLVGKESDRVTHVLVSEPFENCREFFYPEQPVRDLEARPFGKAPVAVDATNARIEMADIPFVPLRNKFTELNEPRRSFDGLVDAYSKAERQVMRDAPKVALDLEKGIMSVEGRPFRLAGRELLIAAFLHERALAGKAHFLNKDEAEKELAEFMIRWKQARPFHRATARLSGGLSKDDIPKALHDLRKKLIGKGLTGAICYLAPDRDRIGFEIRQA